MRGRSLLAGYWYAWCLDRGAVGLLKRGSWRSSFSAARTLPSWADLQLELSMPRVVRASTNDAEELVSLDDKGAENSSRALSETVTWNDSSPTALSQSLQQSQQQSVSIALLNMVAILWGSQHAVIKMVVQDSDAGPFTLLRFGLAALLATPALWNLGAPSNMTSVSTSVDSAEKVLRWGAEMGFWMFLGFSFQAIGLEYTTAQRSGFLLYLNVKFVPFLAYVLLGREIRLATWLSALVAFTGTALLAGSGSSQNGSLPVNIGDLWSMAAALASAMFILRLERASSEITDAATLNAVCLWIVTALAAVWTVGSRLLLSDSGAASTTSTLHDLSTIAASHPLELLYLSGVTTTFANWIQTKAQRDVSAERASVIYAMDPVYGAAFSNWLLGETLNGVQGWIGAGLITVAAATNALVDFARPDSVQRHSIVSGSTSPDDDDVNGVDSFKER